MRAYFNLKQLGDHVGETRAGFERVNGQLSRIGTQNPASAGQENTPPGESRIYDLKEDMTHTRILGKTRDLELCILDNIPDKDIYVCVSIVPHQMLLLSRLS